MSKLFRRLQHSIGLPPGTIVHSADVSNNTIVTLFDYDAKGYQEKKVDDIHGCFPFKESPTVTWINIEGIDPQIIQQLGDHFGVHPLVSEDLINLSHRPKMEDYGDYMFIICKMIYVSPKTDEIIDEQISLIVGSNFVISIQEKEGDAFDPIRERIREAKGRIRSVGADYLAYSLLDAVVDNYYAILEKRAEDIDRIDDEIIVDPHNEVGQEIHQLKRDMIYLRKQIWPLREVISGLQHNESKLIKKQTIIYLRDAYDHVIQVIDMIESFRDILSGIHDSYLSSISNRMNEIMKVLTIFAAIFIPLTFMAGVYGMNFEFMPELKWRYGYFIVLGLMLSVGVGMLLYFKKKKWI